MGSDEVLFFVLPADTTMGIPAWVVPFLSLLEPSQIINWASQSVDSWKGIGCESTHGNGDSKKKLVFWMLWSFRYPPMFVSHDYHGTTFETGQPLARLPAPRYRFQLSDLMQTLETPLNDLIRHGDTMWSGTKISTASLHTVHYRYLYKKRRMMPYVWACRKGDGWKLGKFEPSFLGWLRTTHGHGLVPRCFVSNFDPNSSMTPQHGGEVIAVVQLRVVLLRRYTVHEQQTFGETCQGKDGIVRFKLLTSSRL